MKKDPNVYLIQFEYGEQTHSIHLHSYSDYFKGKPSDKDVMAQLIEDFINSENLHKEGAKVSKARLIGKGDVIFKVDDFSKI